MTRSFDCERILSLDVDVLSGAQAADTILQWAADRQSRYVCAANVHMVMEGWDDPPLQAVFNGADMVVPDGMPLLWALRLLGRPDAHRVRGPDLMLDVCRLAAARGIPVGLYGGRPECSAPLEAFLRRSFPGIRIACHINPPFRPLTEAELRRDAESINESGAQVLFVGIGCPKQERWMSVQRGVIAAPMIGVGAAFDFYGGRTRPAPAWMQRSGLEWLFRLASEPRRLWKRYLKHNPRYVLLAARQILARKRDRD